MPQPLTIYYHCTDAAEAILREGFRDNEGSYMLVGFTLRGVFISDVPCDANQGAKGDQLLEIALPENVDLSYYELVEEGIGYREWCVPAAILNDSAKIRLLTLEEQDELNRKLFGWDRDDEGSD